MSLGGTDIEEEERKDTGWEVVGAREGGQGERGVHSARARINKKVWKKGQLLDLEKKRAFLRRVGRRSAKKRGKEGGGGSVESSRVARRASVSLRRQPPSLS